MAEALERVLRRIGGPGTLESLSGLAGADLTTLLLEVVRRRARRLGARDVLRRYGEDRFVGPASVPFDQLRRTEDLLLSALPEGFEAVTLAPVVPLGTHSVVGTVDQNKVITTIRGSEVAADPTNGLALEAAARRGTMNPRSTKEVRLAAVQRVARAQLFNGAGRSAHFTLMGMVTAGRDTGDLGFERLHVIEHLGFYAGVLPGNISVRVTVLDPRFNAVIAATKTRLSTVDVAEDPTREAGREYYTGLCFKVFTTITGEPFELADGGFVDWTQSLLANRKERLLTSGIGVDRLATALDASAGG